MTRETQPSFAVIVPAYNEEQGIQACVRAIDATLALLPNRTQLIVVDDGSADATAKRVESCLSAFPRLMLIRHSANQGYGAALRSGVKGAAEGGFDYVVFMDSDLTNDPKYLGDFADAMSQRADVVKATRRSAGGGYQGVPLRRILPATIGNAVARPLFGLPLRDSTNGYRAVRTDLLVGLDLKENGFAAIMEELYKLRRVACRYIEVPVILTGRSADLRPSMFDYRPRSLWRYMRYPLLAAVDRLLGR